MPLADLLGRPAIGRKQFLEWAGHCPGIDPVHHYRALRICWPYLQRAHRNILDIGPDPAPWLDTIARFCGSRHQLAGCLQGGTRAADGTPKYSITPVELDIWSPLAAKDLPATLPGQGYDLITALQVVDRLYHPEPFFKAVAKALRPGGTLVLTLQNVGACANIMRLLSGASVCPELAALVQPSAGQRPLVREYCWRELANLALFCDFVPVDHGYYDGAARDDLSSPQGRRINEAFEPFMEHPHQLRGFLYLLFRRTNGLAMRQYTLYLFRKSPRPTFQYMREQLRQYLQTISTGKDRK